MDSSLMDTDWRHTAAAHKMLMWPAVKTLLDQEYDQDYMMMLEEQRGLISLSDPSGIFYTANDTALPTSPLADDGSGCSGCSGSRSSQDETSIMDKKALSQNSDIDQFGLLRLFENTARRYYQSYLDWMHMLHPFLDQQELNQRVEDFIECYCPQNFPPTTDPDTLSKCAQANSDVTGGFVDATSASSGKLVRQDIDNAVILLILALGAICESQLSHSEQIMDQKSDWRLPHIFDLTDSDQDKCEHVRNRPFIPGLALYGYATAILDHIQGGVRLDYVHACLLAGLYAGQLTQPFQSHRWIRQAARTCQLFVRQPRYEELEGEAKELCVFAYWSCLQLESDLLVELDIPASGISRYESRIPFPKGRYATDAPEDATLPSTRVMLYYYSQIHLHKTLNHVHMDLFKVEKEGQTCWLPSVQNAQGARIDLWRMALPEMMSWRDVDEPAKDINAAHMRAKYYRTRYIIHRPMLYYADMQRMLDDIGSFAPSNPSLLSSQDWIPPVVNLSDMPILLRLACKICIESAILHTTAFDGIENRLVLTNIFGTAHAKFGNMLVLAATYNSSLSELVERSTLDRLFKHTIRFLLRYGNTSAALCADARILNQIYSKLFGGPPVLTDA
ncbi:hypothetical protein N7448_009595 [Penicillium atrosanguineum]|nr:hypothetical protein N7448_009595 [Penicillium atrosanguineum]